MVSKMANVTLKTWADARVKPDKALHWVLHELAQKANVSYSTVRNCYHGMRVARYATAEAISKATKGEVSIEGLVR